jgi:hypothetical protein
MLLKYNFITPELFHQNIKDDGLILHPVLEKYILDNISKLQKNTIVFTNTYDVINSNDDYNKRIPIYYNMKYNTYNLKNNKNISQIYKLALSFEQNNMNLSSEIRNKVVSIITLSNNTLMNNKSIKRILLGIGGEYYVYQFLFKNFGYSQMLGFTNNKYIQQDAEYNYNLHNMTEYTKSYLLNSYLNLLIEYHSELDFDLEEIISQLTKHNTSIDIIINLSKLNVNVLQFIVRFKKNINSTTIISCNEKDFNTKIQLLPSEFTTNMNTYDFVDEKLKQKISVYHTKFQSL